MQINVMLVLQDTILKELKIILLQLHQHNKHIHFPAGVSPVLQVASAHLLIKLLTQWQDIIFQGPNVWHALLLTINAYNANLPARALNAQYVLLVT